MQKYIILILKGIGMGAANVIPGVSGGTIALITGIFERLIHSIKSFNIKAIRLFFSGKFKEFAKHTDIYFLLAILIGIIIAVVSLAKVFDFLFINYPVYIWSFFFGLVLASVYFVGKTISKWSTSVVITFIIGVAIAVYVSTLNPAVENKGFVYLMFCGVAAICSMILPGLSGSFILVILGNYKLVAIDAINNRDIEILIPVLLGAVVGLLAFSHFLSWVFKKYKNQTIAILTGFILGSLSILWPWQKKIYLYNEFNELIIKKGEPVVARFERIIPETFNNEVMTAIIFVLVGIASIWLIEKLAKIK